MKYYIKVTQTYATKNKLEKAIYEALNKHDGTLLEKKRLSTFKDEIHQKVIELNDAHPRCTFKEFKKFNPNPESLTMYVENVIYLNAYPVKIES